MTQGLADAGVLDTPEGRARLVKRLAHEAGFDLVGVAPLDPPPPASGHLTEWLARGHAAGMTYLTAQADKRGDLRRAFPWARSVVCVALQYDTPWPYSTVAPPDRGWISRYAWGDDYHDIVGVALERLRTSVHAALGACQARAYVDTGPITERAYAAAAGLGWLGRNTCLIDERHGSWLFLGELVTDLELAPDGPVPDRCGTCTACLAACPTGALVAPHVLDARLCISYLTIEERGAIPEPLRNRLGRHVFGCDICQDVCPWNRRRRHQGRSCFAPRPGLFAPDLAALAHLNDADFRTIFRKSAVRRAKHAGFLRNVALAAAQAPAPT